MALKTTKFDVADHLKAPEDCAAYLEAVFEDGDPRVIAPERKNTCARRRRAETA